MSKKILVVVGSLRNNGFNKQVGDYVVKKLSEKEIEAKFLDYTNVPFLNQDIEYPAPTAVADIRNKVKEAHGVWFVTPEYNGFIPGVLKNLLDWLSRPLVAFDFESPKVLTNKPVTISGAAGKSGASGSRSQLATLLGFDSKLIGGEGTGIVLQPESFSTGILELTDSQKLELDTQVEEFIKNI
ncbi:NADPH-dependent FMN reductase [Gemella cuniculi]|uniref:NADPH-dependent FMN reductase n=1 Tax=Gemella cuniculi TaxID=150240 RepID=UPI0003F8802B|nr:NADPH-dependent FMN reductase [Gemella cuniculi]